MDTTRSSPVVRSRPPKNNKAWPVVSGAPESKPPARLARTGEVLDLVRRGKAKTTTDLAKSMGIARSTVTERLELLFRHGLVMTAGETSPGRGRPAGVLAFNERAGVTLAAQVGMSGTLAAVTDLAGEVLWSNQADLDVAEGPEALFTLLEKQFHAGLTHLGESADQVYGVGIGLPGDLEIAAANGGGSATPASWTTYPLAEHLSETFGGPAFIDRDVNFMAVAEHRIGWPEAKVLLSLKVGTVIACGLIIDGQVARGATGLSGEIGHIKVHGSDDPCLCGSQGCLNAVAGAAALATRLHDQGFDAHTARDLATLANQGILPAGQAVRQAGRQVGEVVAAVINLLNPDVVTVWGYLVDAGDQFLAGMHEAIYKAALPSAARALTLTPTQLGDDAGLRGAALTVIEHALNPDAIDTHLMQVSTA